MCDLHRQLSKFHLTVTLPPKITPEQKLMEKCRAVLCSDANTPVLGQLAQRAHQLSNGFKELTAETTEEMRLWGVEIDPASQYPNKYQPWMNTVVQQQFGMQFDGFQKTLDDITNFKGLLTLPCLFEATVPEKNPFPVVLSKTVIVPAPEQTQNATVTTTTPGKTNNKQNSSAPQQKAAPKPPPTTSANSQTTQQKPARTDEVVFTEGLNKSIRVQAIKLAWKHVGENKHQHAALTDKFATILASLITTSKITKVTNHLKEASEIYAAELSARAVGPAKV